MEAVAVVTILMVIECFVFSALTGRARVKYDVKAPATVGPPEFERHYRVHQNTLEQLMLVLPSMWVFGLYVHAPTAAGLGLVFVVARVLYLRSYVAAPDKRGPGFIIGFLATLVLMLGGLIGAVMSWVS